MIKNTKRDDTKSDARGIKLQPKIHFRLQQKRKLVEAQPLGKHDLKYHLPFITNYSISTNHKRFSVLFSQEKTIKTNYIKDLSVFSQEKQKLVQCALLEELVSNFYNPSHTPNKYYG